VSRPERSQHNSRCHPEGSEGSMHYCLQRQDLRSALSAICRLLREIRDTPATKKLAWSDRIREGPEFTRASLPPTTKGGAWTETALFTFKGHARSDGATPEGGLVIESGRELARQNL
jgi:hypothetical protein